MLLFAHFCCFQVGKKLSSLSCVQTARHVTAFRPCESLVYEPVFCTLNTHVPNCTFGNYWSFHLNVEGSVVSKSTGKQGTGQCEKVPTVALFSKLEQRFQEAPVCEIGYLEAGW